MHQLSPKAENISIHALLAESDRLCTILYSCPGNFYPRSPCGERRLMGSRGTGLWNFYPRSPCGERHNAGPLPTVCRDFYPRSPCGERHIIPICMGVTAPISIHALLAESDNSFLLLLPCLFQFLSTLSLRRATSVPISILHCSAFLSTLSLRRATPEETV